MHFASADGHVDALRPDGTERWRYPAAGAAALAPLYSTPAEREVGSLVIGSDNPLILCLNGDGTLRWSFPVGDWVDSSPLITDDGSIIIGCQDKSLTCLNGTEAPLHTDWPQYRRDSQHTAWQPLGLATNTTGRIINMSVRSPISVGQTVTVGTWIGGTGSRTLLARAVGPTLASFGVSPVLADPLMKLFRQGSYLSENDNWEQAPNLAQLTTATGSYTGFALGKGSLDAALLQTFPSGGYTLEVTGKTAQAGSCLIELYDAGGDATARITNISAHTDVGMVEVYELP